MVDLLRDRESEMHSLNSKWRKSILFTLLQNAKERIHSTPNNTFVYWAQSIQNHFSYFMQETFRFFFYLRLTNFFLCRHDWFEAVLSMRRNVGDGWICFWFPLNSLWIRRLLHSCGFAFRNICSVFSCISPFDFTAQWFYSSIFILVLVFHLRDDSYVSIENFEGCREVLIHRVIIDVKKYTHTQIWCLDCMKWGWKFVEWNCKQLKLFCGCMISIVYTMPY